MKSNCRLYIENNNPSQKDMDEYFEQAKSISKFISGEAELYVGDDIYYFDDGEMIEQKNNFWNDVWAEYGGLIGIAIMGLIMFLTAWLG